MRFIKKAVLSVSAIAIAVAIIVAMAKIDAGEWLVGLIGLDLTLTITLVASLVLAVQWLRRPTVWYPEGLLSDVVDDRSFLPFAVIMTLLVLISGGFALAYGLTVLGVTLFLGAAGVFFWALSQLRFTTHGHM